MATTPKKRQSTKAKAKAKAGVVIKPLSLTPETIGALQTLSGSLSDLAGRKVSASAMVRALASYASKQPYAWLQDELLPIVQEEQLGGLVWGHKE